MDPTQTANRQRGEDRRTTLSHKLTLSNNTAVACRNKVKRAADAAAVVVKSIADLQDSLEALSSGHEDDESLLDRVGNMDIQAEGLLRGLLKMERDAEANC